MNELKPVTFIKGGGPKYGKDELRQNKLLEAMQTTTDIGKLKEMVGVKTEADITRLLDKLSLRKEYHKVLSEQQLDLTTIVKSLKQEMLSAEKSSDRIKCIEIAMKSLGIDKYEEDHVGGGSWEDILNKVSKDNTIDGEIVDEEDYHVVAPQLPESVKKIKEDEAAVAKSLYE